MHPSITFAGHFAIDSIIRFQKEHPPTLGGSVTFGPLALSTYTDEVEIRIISNLGKLNFKANFLDEFKKSNINLEGVNWTEGKNTNFILEYSNHTRTLTLKSRSPDIKFKNIPENYLEHPPDALILVPLCCEISLDFISDVLDHFPDALVGIDLQGFLREIDEDGSVSLAKDEDVREKVDQIINLIGNHLILKGSEEEMKIFFRKEDLVEVMKFFQKYEGLFIMTLGQGGSMIYERGKEILKIPSFKPEKTVDETGAGDVYLAIFLYEFLTSNKSWEAIEEAGLRASASASFLVEHVGPKGFGSKEDVLERLKKKNYFKFKRDN